MLGFISNLEEASFSTTLCITCSIFLLVLVGVDKKIKFHKVIGIEHMLRMKKFSSSQTYFKISLCLPIAVIGFLVAIFKTIYTEANPDRDSVITYSNFDLSRDLLRIRCTITS